MSISYHRTVCFISSVLLLTACESDTDELQRLNGDRAVACLLAQKYEREYLEARTPKCGTATSIPTPRTPYIDSLGREWVEYKTKCELAERDLNRFMRE